jgi:hypothetical protein
MQNVLSLALVGLLLMAVIGLVGTLPPSARAYIVIISICLLLVVALWIVRIQSQLKAIEAAKKRTSDEIMKLGQALCSLFEDGTLTQRRANDLIASAEYKRLAAKDIYKAVEGACYSICYQAEPVPADSAFINHFSSILNGTDLAKCRQIIEVRNHRIPVLSDVSITLKPKEVAHFCWRAGLCQERVVERHYEGGYAGMSFSLGHGARIYTGGSRGHLVATRAVAPIAMGDIILTSQRLVFSGESNSFSLPWAKVIGATMTKIEFGPALRIVRDSVAQNNKPYYFVVEEEADFVELTIGAIRGSVGVGSSA